MIREKKMKQINKLCTAWLTLFTLGTANALELPQYLNFDGQLLDSADAPIMVSTEVMFEIYNPSGNCLLHRETRTIIPDATTGEFSAQIGPGASGGTQAGISVDGDIPWTQIFRNDGGAIRATSTPNCALGYTPIAQEGRILRVTINPNDTTPAQLSPDFTLAPVPMASVAETLQGKAPSDFLPSSGAASLNGSLKILDNNQLQLASSLQSNYVSLQAPPSLSPGYNLIFPSTAGTTGQVLTKGAGDNLSWTTPSSNGITSLSGSTTSVQTLSIASTGSAPSWTHTTSDHKLSIPLASAGGVTAGLISNTEYSTFNNKVSTTRALNTLAGSGLSGGGDLSANRNLALDISGTTALGAVPDNTDEILIFDTSASLLRKVTRSQFNLSEAEVDMMVANNGFGQATVDDSLNFDKFTDAMNLDASTDIAVGTYALAITNDGAGNSLVVNDNGAGDTTPFVIDGQGNVGIGTTTSSNAKLKINNSMGSTHAAIFSSTASSTPTVSIISTTATAALINATSGTAPALDVQTGGVTRLYVGGNGNIGVNKTAPTASLDVDGIIKANSMHISNFMQLVPLATPPVGAPTGSIAYNSTANIICFFNGSFWKDMMGGTSCTGW
jgi:hypothetical protein